MVTCSHIHLLLGIATSLMWPSKLRVSGFAFCCKYGIAYAKRDLTHVFSRFQLFEYSRSLKCRLENRSICHEVVRR